MPAFCIKMYILTLFFDLIYMLYQYMRVRKKVLKIKIIHKQTF